MFRKMGGVGITAWAILLLCAVSSVNSYSKYGRGCADIGCMPNEQCVMASDSCSYSQREGKDCGTYPTCTKKSGAGGSSSSVNPSGSALSPSFPHGLQPVNPYNPPFVFGQQPFYGPTGTGGPPNGVGILGGGGGGLVPHGMGYGGAGVGGYQNPNMFNKPPPQYQNQPQNPYNRQTQSHPSSAARIGGATTTMTVALSATLAALGCIAGARLLQQNFDVARWT